MDRREPARSVTRRSVLAAACVAAASATLASCAPRDAAASTEDPSEKRVQYGFWMDSRNCVGCASCVAACRQAIGTPEDGEARRKTVAYRFERGGLRFVSLSCMHCAQPACLAACPAGAIGKRADGIVVVDQGRCIGCRYCHEACPFGTPHYTPQGMDKCDCCLGAGVEPGREPYCVQACPADALHFGELEEMRPQAEAAGATGLLEAPTGPSFFLT